MENDIGQLRIDLAAALRWAARFGLNEGVCNHFSAAVSPDGDRFLVNPLGFHWSEIRASDLVVADAEGRVIEGAHQVEQSAFYIHSRIHLARPRARCVLHTHMSYATALCTLEGGRLEMVEQNALRFHDRIAYDEDYNGLAHDTGEGDRMAAALGNRDIAFLGGHGIIVTGPTIQEAFDDLYYLERACKVQVLARSTGLPFRPIRDPVRLKTAAELNGPRPLAKAHFDALKRILDREEPEYRA